MRIKKRSFAKMRNSYQSQRNSSYGGGTKKSNFKNNVNRNSVYLEKRTKAY